MLLENENKSIKMCNFIWVSMGFCYGFCQPFNRPSFQAFELLAPELSLGLVVMAAAVVVAVLLPLLIMTPPLPPTRCSFIRGDSHWLVCRCVCCYDYVHSQCVSFRYLIRLNGNCKYLFFQILLHHHSRHRRRIRRRCRR